MSGKLYFLEVFFTKRPPPEKVWEKLIFFWGGTHPKKLKKHSLKCLEMHLKNKFCYYILDYFANFLSMFRTDINVNKDHMDG